VERRKVLGLEYSFPWPDQNRGYNLFPEELEDDELIAFHGTAEANRQSIVNDGFKFGRPPVR
jgi:hypothetical protein